MKKILSIVLAVLFVAVIVNPSFAKTAKSAKKYDRIVADIVSIDATANTIVVKEEKSGASRTVKVSARAVSQIKVGDRVRIKLNPGTNVSAGVRVLKDKSKVEPQDAPVEPAAVPAVVVPASVNTEKK